MRQFRSLAIVAASAGVLAVSSSAFAVPVYGLTTDNTLFTFDSATPGTITSGGAITGLSANESLVGIDFRPATGALIGVTNFNRIVSVGTTPSVNFGTTTTVATLSAPLNGTSFDIDFNPTVDRIRIVGDAGQNLRVNPDTGAATVDGNLSYGTATSPNIVGAAYTNSFPGSTTTTLYTIDSGTNTLNIQNPPNNGTQVVTGPLGIDVTNLVGFDIGAGNIGYASLQDSANGFSQFYTLNLTTGAAGAGSPIGGGLFVRDITVVPEPVSLSVVGLAAVGLLARRRRA